MGHSIGYSIRYCIKVFYRAYIKDKFQKVFKRRKGIPQGIYKVYRILPRVFYMKFLKVCRGDIL